MTLDQLNTFLLASGELNFSRTARLLHLSQSAVSQQIRELEEDLGVTLFERRNRAISLTPGGERLRLLASTIVRDVKRARAELESLKGVPQGVLRIGATMTPGVYLLPHALGRYSQRFPGIRTGLRITHAEELLSLLNAGELDLAVVEEDPAANRTHGWERTPLMQDELVLIVPPEHPWSAREAIAPDELSSQPFIFRQQDSKTRQLILDRLSEAGVAPESLVTRFELSNTEGIKHAVMAGLGVGFVSCFAMAIERRARLLVDVPIAGVSITRTLWLLKPPPARAFAHQERFCELLGRADWLPASFTLAQSEPAVSAHDA